MRTDIGPIIERSGDHDDVTIRHVRDILDVHIPWEIAQSHGVQHTCIDNHQLHLIRIIHVEEGARVARAERHAGGHAAANLDQQGGVACAILVPQCVIDVGPHCCPSP